MSEMLNEETKRMTEIDLKSMLGRDKKTLVSTGYKELDDLLMGGVSAGITVVGVDRKAVTKDIVTTIGNSVIRNHDYYVSALLMENREPEDRTSDAVKDWLHELAKEEKTKQGKTVAVLDLIDFLPTNEEKDNVMGLLYAFAKSYNCAVIVMTSLDENKIRAEKPIEAYSFEVKRYGDVFISPDIGNSGLDKGVFYKESTNKPATDSKRT